MLQSRPQTTSSLFRTSLRDWQANWKARQAEQASRPPEQAAEQRAAGAEPGQPRVKRLIAHKKRKQKRLAEAAAQR
jgi:hypothetical protein